MPWSTKNCLNRWCLRTLREGCASALYNQLHAGLGGKLLALPRHHGRPPLRHSCIAPHCDQWRGIDAEHGVCLYRQKLNAALDAH